VISPTEDNNRVIEEAAETQADQRGRQLWNRVMAALTHPLGIVFITFLLTGVVATSFAKWLDNLSKAHEVELAAQQRAVDSVRNITDLLYERRTRGVLLSSSIKRNASFDEIKERKHSYDDVFVRYNSTLQSNMFRIRDIFHTADYTRFEAFLEERVQPLFVSQDRCLTSAYDSEVSNDDAKRRSAVDVLVDCNKGNPPSVSVGKIEQVLLDCTYAFTDALFRVVQTSDWPQGTNRLTPDIMGRIARTCAQPEAPPGN
jgi:hypothetical protein